MAPYLTPADLRAAVPAISTDPPYTDAVLAGYVTEFEEIAEDYLGAAYTPRTATDTFTAVYGTAVRLLEHTNIRSITSAVVDGVTATVDTFELTGSGVVYRAAGLGGRTVTVTYEHGHDEPPETLLRACRQYVRSVALADQSGVSRDVIAQSFEGMTTRYSTPSKRDGRPTGYLEVDRLLNNLPNERAPRIAG